MSQGVKRPAPEIIVFNDPAMVSRVAGLELFCSSICIADCLFFLLLLTSAGLSKICLPRSFVISYTYDSSIHLSSSY